MAQSPDECLAEIRRLLEGYDKLLKSLERAGGLPPEGPQRDEVRELSPALFS